MFTFRYASLEKYVTEQIVSSTKKQPLLETPGEVSCGLFVIMFLIFQKGWNLKVLFSCILIFFVNSK